MRSICRNRKPCSPLYLLFILLAGPSAIAQQARPPWEEARAAQIEAARREGIPLTQADLQGASIPADRNAATYLAKIRELDKNSPVSPLEAAALEDVKKADPTPEQIALGRKALEAHRERSRLLRLAAECPSYSEAIPPLDVDGIVMPDTFVRDAQFREYARWLVAESMVLLYEGKPLAAVQTDALVFGLARQVASPGSIISLLVSEAVDSIALGGIRVVLYHDGEDVTVAEAVVQAIDRRRGAPNLGLALRGEVVMMLAMSDSQRRQMPAMPHFKPGDLSVPPFENTAAFRAAVKKYHYPADPKRALA